MSYRKLFENNKQTTTVSKYLKKSSPSDLGDGIESGAHLTASVEKREYFLPHLNYSDPKNFVKFGSAKRYYNNAFTHILNNYPYDGSNLETTTFYNELNPLEKYILEDEYPRSTGYVSIGSDYGATATDTSGYYSSSAEYIQVKGGPHVNTKYSVTNNRTNNLQFGATQGTTIEFFLKKTAFGSSPFSTASPKEVIFDAWNGELSSSAQYGRLTVELSASTPDRFYVTMQSGTAGFYRTAVPTTGGLTLIGDSWRQFSFVVGSSSAGNTIDFYQSGTCVGPTITTGSTVMGNVTGSLIANLGALRAAPSGSTTPLTAEEGWGKLSGSLDEFRFWKGAKTPEDIGRDWFSRVYGGSDNYLANVDLGVYFRFNAGITEDSSIDSVVLDYSGRLSNGAYVGYSTNSRNTGSAVNDLALTSVREIGDPIVRSSNTNYTTKRDELVNRGENYDYTNNSYLMNTMPAWIYEEDENSNGELGNITQIMASYFDTLSNQISELSKLKEVRYLSGSSTGSINEFPFNDRLLDNVGLEAPELFENAGILQQFFERDEQINFDQRLVAIKNSIYRNIYNNINHVYKSKGTQTAIRNLIRCFGIGDEIVDLNIYANQADYPLITNYNEGVSSKKYIDFSGLTNRQDSFGTVYQYYNSSNDASVGLITGTVGLQQFAFTIENDIVFPAKTNVSNLDTSLPSILSASLFGFHSPKYTSQTSTNLTWANSAADYGLQIYAVKKAADYAEITAPTELIKDVFFVVEDSHGNTLATSSLFQNVYENQRWNLSLGIKPAKYPFSDEVDGATVAASGYTLEFYGVNYDTGIKRNNFYVTADMSYTSGSAMLTGSKRLYMGTHRTNFSGTVLESTDVRSTGLRYWTDSLPTGTINLHAREADSFGRKHPYRQAYTYQGANVPPLYIPKIATLALNWDFADVTGSDSNGRFYVSDFSSGSDDGNYLSIYQGDAFSPINLRQHTGRGDYFEASKTPAQKQYVYTEKMQLPEYIDSDEMTNVMSTDDIVFTTSIRPINFYFSLEKSMYRSISNRMLQLFASIEDMNNLIGEPVNRFRPHYKAMEKLRQVFFQKVGNVPDFEKYVKFYKWIDAALGDIVIQLFPASSAHSDSLRTMVENHLLERPKIQHHYIGNMKKVPQYDIRGTVTRVSPLCGDASGWKFNHAPIPLLESSNGFWWKTRAERDSVQFGSPTGGVLNTRNKVFREVQAEFTSSAVYCFKGGLGNNYIGGINQYINKKRNIKDITFDSFQVIPTPDDLPPNRKKKFAFRATKDSVNYKGQLLTPFTAISSSVKSGYRSILEDNGFTGVDFSNLHEDSIYPFRHSVPMQGPFTRTHVGGFQSRHVAPLTQLVASDNKRSEQYTLSLVTGTGSITSITTGASPKGFYLRGLGSKSPVNISNVLTTTGSGITAGVNILGNYSKNYEVIQTSDRYANNMDFVFNNDNYAYSAPTTFLTTPARRTLGLTGSADYPAPRQRYPNPVAAASAVDAIDTTGVKAASVDSAFSFTIPTTTGGEGGATTIRLSATETVAPPVAGAGSSIGIGFADKTDAQIAALIINAINAVATTNIVFAVSHTGMAGYDSGITATEGSSNTQITLTIDRSGTAGNLTSALVDTMGTSLVDLADFTGGAGVSDLSSRRPVRTNDTIIVEQFAAPGGKQESKQQFRDVPSNQYSPNNALPFRNMAVRQPNNISLKTYTGWGGFKNADVVGILNSRTLQLLNDGSGSFAAVHKTQRNTTRRIVLSGTLASPEIYMTGTIRDNSYVTRPIPQADRLQWFMGLSGSNTNLFDTFVLSGSRIPEEVLIPSASFVAGGTSTGSIEFLDLAALAGTSFDLTSSINGNAVRFTADGTNVMGVWIVVDANNVSYGMSNAVTTPNAASVAQTAVAVAKSNSLTNLDINAVWSGGASSVVQLTQSMAGCVQNTSIGGVMPSLNATLTGFGSPDHRWCSLYLGESGYKEYLWGGEAGYAPFTQLRQGETTRAKYLTRRNIYETVPTSYQYYDWRPGRLGGPVGRRKILFGGTDTYQDQATNTISSRYKDKFFEPPVTSRYKPLIHQIKTWPGSPAKTEYSKDMEVTLQSSYGNQLQGFANRKLNNAYGHKASYKLGQEKRPYEIIRDNKNSGLDSVVDGIRMVKLMAYEETIYPREVYTYMSGSRARLAFVNNFWKPDTHVNDTAAQAGVGTYTNFIGLPFPSTYRPINRQSKRLQTPLTTSLGTVDSYTTSQGYRVEAIDQWSYTDVGVVPSGYGTGSIWALDSFLYSDYIDYFPNTSYPTVVAAAGAMASGELLGTRYGPLFDDTVGNIQYLTSSVRASQYIYGVPTETVIASIAGAVPDVEIEITDGDHSNWNDSIIVIIDNAASPNTCVFTFVAAASSPARTGAGAYDVGIGAGSSGDKDALAAAFSASIELAVQSFAELSVVVPAFAAATLPITGTAQNPNLNGTSPTYTPKVTPQATIGTWSGGVLPVVGGSQAEARSPGSIFTRPPWTAGRTRRVVDGQYRGQLAAPHYPFYKSYEAYESDVRLAGQSFTIVPEFRISEHIAEYSAYGDVLSQVTTTLSLTGASSDVYSGQNTDFYGRYSTTDFMEYLRTFMGANSPDLEFNKRPRHFGIKSEAIMKLLPYEGFYPSDRALQISTLFSGAYSSAATFTGTDSENRQQWNSLLCPFFAPGILYNSIKSGIGVEYPVWREGRNHSQFQQTPITQPLAAGLSGTLTSIGAGQIPGKSRRAPFDFSDVDVDRFFWSDKIPFEGILKPMEYINDQRIGIIPSDTNRTLINNNITASIDIETHQQTGLLNESLYKLAVSNFLASVPKFFLTEKPEGGHLSKFVGEIAPASVPTSPAGTAPTSQEVERTVNVKANTAYTMEVGVRKTESFNMYSNPYAFGQPTATGSSVWTGTPCGLKTAGTIPPAPKWPTHRAEFAPFAPPYYYGASYARLTYLPTVAATLTLREILDSDELYVEYGNDNGYLYDFDSGSFMLDSTTKQSVSTTTTPTYGWNRAWQNRMDVDASLVIDNNFPTSDGAPMSPRDRNKWVIMPKWECPILDFPSGSYGDATRYDFSSSIVPTEYTSSTHGMWHQYGVMPESKQGVYLYLADVDADSSEFRLAGNPSAGAGYVYRTRKIPDYVWAASASVESLAKLVGFKAEDVMPASTWVPAKAKRLGELAKDEEKTMSEAIIAIPYFYSGEENGMQAMTMTASPTQLGPKIKEFRKVFTKYSLPPALETALNPLLPIDYPEITDFINPFGGDEYDAIQPGTELTRVPVVYLLEHTVTLKRQDLADIWQGIMPDVARTLKVDVTAIDHYMPGVLAPEPGIGTPTFPEWIEKELELGLARNGHPRVDLIDTVPELIKNGFQPEIRWLVFRAKERGALGYDSMLYEELNGGASALSYNHAVGYISDSLPDAVKSDFELQKAAYTKGLYLEDQGPDPRVTYNWPYDYCSLIELGKISTRVGFRPDLKKELEEFDEINEDQNNGEQ